MPNYIRAGVKISVSRCYGVMRPDLKFLVQIFITVYREGQRPSVKRDLSCVRVWGRAFSYILCLYSCLHVSVNQ